MCPCFTWHIRRVFKKWITKTFISNCTRDESDRFIHVLHNQRQNMVSDRKHEQSPFPNLVTHNPQAVKLHGLVIEVLDFLKPPLCCGRSQEVGESSVRSV